MRSFHARPWLALLALALPLAAPAISVTQAFNGSAPGWSLLGSASVGAAPGWLSLTPASGSQAGSAIYNTAFPNTEGVQVTFEYAAYGGALYATPPRHGDGLAFYLINGAETNPSTGGSGGSLGYSGNRTGTAGVRQGYVGIGFDEYGGFSGCPNGPGTAAAPCQDVDTPGRVAIRGRGNAADDFANDFKLLAAATPTGLDANGIETSGTYSLARRSTAIP